MYKANAFGGRCTRGRRPCWGILAMAASLLAIVLLITSAVGSGPPPKEWVTATKIAAGPLATPQEHRVIYRSSVINSKVVALQDSPDVPVTTLSNTTQSENSVFVDPNNPQILINSNNSSDWPVTQIYGADYWVSVDGGQTWTGSVLGAGGANRGDPTTAIDLNGRMFVGFIASDYGQGIAYSDDQGVNWTPVQVAPGGYILDKNHLWVDNSAASAYEGNLYSAWTNFQSGSLNYGEIEFRRSTNGGFTWSSPSLNLSSAVGAGSHNQGVNIQTGPNGEVYVVWTIYDSWPSDETALGLAKSTNGGSSFASASRIITGIRGHRNTSLGGGKTMRHNSFPSMTVNQQTGEVYVVWTNIGVPGVNIGDPDIYMISSTDGGSTWSTPTRVNQDTQGNGKDQWFPWIACDPVTGTLACIFHDSRNFPSNDMAETFVAVSTDNGATWEDFLVSDAAWSGDGIPGFSGNYAGDYLGIAGRNNTFYPMWGDDRSGNFLTYVSPFTVTGGPVAEFTGAPTSGCATLTVDFTDQSTGDITSWLWDFGDTATSTLQNPSHDYVNPGTYTVSLTVSGPAGSDTETKVDYITVYGAPVADFSGTPTTGCAPVEVDFTDLSTEDPDSWNWDFGDTGTSTEQNPTHTYQSAGTYTVTLTASNSCGSDVETKVGYIQVDPPCGVKAFALSDIPVKGDVTGTYVDTHASDGVYQSITEVHSGGKPSGRYSLLEHKWDFNVTAGSTITFNVEAYRPDNGDGDDFSFQYSTDNTSFVPLVTVNSALEQAYSAPMPSNVSGAVYVRVVDTDHTAGNLSYDPVYIDWMYIESSGTPPPPDTMFVNSIDVVRVAQKGNRYNADATVVIHNQDAEPVSGAAVLGHFSGPTTETVSGLTATDGSVVLSSSRVKNPVGTWCFTVDDISLGANEYDPSRNVETTDCEGAAGGIRPSDISWSGQIPSAFQLTQNDPNPFSSATEVRFYVPVASKVTLVVHDVLGRKVATLADRDLDPGWHTYTWDAKSMASGIYFFCLEAGQFVDVKKGVLVR